MILNIEMDHVDYFESMEHIKRSFRGFASIAKDGVCVANIDDENVRDALSGFEGKILWFGVEKDADFTAKNIEKKGHHECHGSPLEFMFQNITGTGMCINYSTIVISSIK